MTLKSSRKSELLAWLAGQPNGETTFTNAQLSTVVDSATEDYSGTIRISETLRALEEDGSITIERGRRHPSSNPSGRIIRINTF